MDEASCLQQAMGFHSASSASRRGGEQKWEPFLHSISCDLLWKLVATQRFLQQRCTAISCSKKVLLHHTDGPWGMSTRISCPRSLGKKVSVQQRMRPDMARSGLVVAEDVSCGDAPRLWEPGRELNSEDSNQTVPWTQQKSDCEN